jgi:nicotinamidase-related amidase
MHRITELYFCGIYSGCCVYFSAADSAMRGIQPYLVIDASSSTSARQHALNRANFEAMLGPVMTTNQVLKSI